MFRNLSIFVKNVQHEASENIINSIICYSFIKMKSFILFKNHTYSINEKAFSSLEFFNITSYVAQWKFVL